MPKREPQTLLEAFENQKFDTPAEFIADMVANRREIIARHRKAMGHKKGGKAAVDKLEATLERFAREDAKDA